MSSPRPRHNGILLVDKEAGWTSHDVVAKVRRLYEQKKVGHTGTLDPAATGLLVVCLGKATRLAEYMTGHDKSYAGTIRLGIRTETDDAEGAVLEQRPVPTIDDTTLRALESRFTGELEQVPPQYSAVKTAGTRAYAVARRGGVTNLEPRPVTIRRLALRRQPESESLEAEVSCTAGTYIRSLARDIGEALGCGAHLSTLRRLSAGPFSVDEAMALATIESTPADERASLLLPLIAGVRGLPCLHVSAHDARLLASGLAVEAPATMTPVGPIVVTTGAGTLVGVGERRTDSTVRCSKVLVAVDELEPA